MTTTTMPAGAGTGTPEDDGSDRKTYTLLKWQAEKIQQTPDGNAIATQIARLALKGHVVIKGDVGDFTVCKYGLTRYCKDFAEFAAFAKKVGAA